MFFHDEIRANGGGESIWTISRMFACIFLTDGRYDNEIIMCLFPALVVVHDYITANVSGANAIVRKSLKVISKFN